MAPMVGQIHFIAACILYLLVVMLEGIVNCHVSVCCGNSDCIVD